MPLGCRVWSSLITSGILTLCSIAPLLEGDKGKSGFSWTTVGCRSPTYYHPISTDTLLNLDHLARLLCRSRHTEQQQSAVITYQLPSEHYLLIALPRNKILKIVSLKCYSSEELVVASLLPHPILPREAGATTEA